MRKSILKKRIFSKLEIHKFSLSSDSIKIFKGRIRNKELYKFKLIFKISFKFRNNLIKVIFNDEVKINFYF